MEKISFCIPCYNSSGTITQVIDEIIEVVSTKSDQYEYEIVTAIDGSPDNVWEVLKDLASKNPNIVVINLSKNFSQANARIASLNFSTGDYVVCLDDDGQCPMNEFWNLFEPITKGRDVSVAKYSVKKQSKFKNIGSNINKKMVKSLFDPPEGFVMSNFFVMRRYVVDEVIKYNNPYPYMTGLLLRITRNFDYVEMEDRDRISGTTGYSFTKLLSLWMNGFTSFSVKPLRISSFIGAASAICGFILCIIVVVRKLFVEGIEDGWTSVIAVNLFIGGTILLMLGMIGEYIGRMFICMNNAPQYVIKDTINVCEKREK